MAMSHDLLESLYVRRRFSTKSLNICRLPIDNGNKLREWQLYVPLLSSGDVFDVHDWGTEFHEHDVIGNVTPFIQSECESIESMTRFFRL